MEKSKITFDNYEVNMYNCNAYTVAKEFVGKEMKKGMMLGIFGLEGVGKTKLLQAIANYYKEIEPKTIVYISKEELYQEIEKAIKKKDIFLISLKRKVKNAAVVCIDEVSEFLCEEELKDYFMTWFHYCKSHRKRLVYTQNCSEEMYCVLQTMGNLERVTLVGIPKEEQNRNIDVIKEMERR